MTHSQTRRRRHLRTGLLAAAMAAPAALAHAQTPTVTFYFTQQGSTTPITSLAAAPNQTINLSVYVQSLFPANTADVFIGYDRATALGSGATRIDNKVVLKDPLNDIANINPAFQAGPGDLEEGARGTGTRPYGDDISVVTKPTGSLFTASTATRLFDISLMTTAGFSGSEALTIYSVAAGSDSGAAGTDSTTYLTNGAGVFARPITATLTLSVTPEPSGLLALALGASGLGLMAWRRRRAV